MDYYFSADIETDGSIPGPFSILSFALVFAGTYDGSTFVRPKAYDRHFYRELRPISEEFEAEALAVNGLDRDFLIRNGESPAKAMTDAYDWVSDIAQNGDPVFVAYPLSFDWTWMYWYFMRFCPKGSPFGYSRCFDIKTALAVKSRMPVAASGRGRLPEELKPSRPHTHHALDDAIEQAEIFGNIFQWEGN
ncbi:MAG: exonuclease [Rhizobium sp.]|nr:MAG: exonuclease [Rhizobium sp.]